MSTTEIQPTTASLAQPILAIPMYSRRRSRPYTQLRIKSRYRGHVSGGRSRQTYRIVSVDLSYASCFDKRVEEAVMAPVTPREGMKPIITAAISSLNNCCSIMASRGLFLILFSNLYEWLIISLDIIAYT